MSNEIVSFKNRSTHSLSHKRCSIVSSVLLQNVHFGFPMSLILYNKVFVAKILWLILLWNHWTVLSLVILNGLAKLFFPNIFAPNSQDNAFSLLHVWGAKNRQMMLLNFFIIFYYLMLNQIFPRLSTKIFSILHKLDEINYLNSSCRSQSWSGWYISPSSTS